MMIKVDFSLFQQYISCSSDVGGQIEQLQHDFLEWIYNKQIDHPYWLYKDGSKFAVNYRADAFLYWLNRIRFNHTVAELVEAGPDASDQAAKTIWF